MNFTLVAPVLYTHAQSRPAHFNWTLMSSGGGEPRWGQYACGSYWVAPAIGDTGVQVVSLLGSGNPGQTDFLTLDADPRPHSHGLCCMRTKRWASDNASENEVPNLPKVFTPPSGSAISLVAGMQRNEEETGGGGTNSIVGAVMDAYCVVTVVHAPPPEAGVNSLRPNFLGDVKQFLTWADLDLTRLPSHSFLGSATVSELETSRIRWTHSTEVFSMATWNGTAFESYSEGGRAFRSHILHDEYGGSRASTFNGAVAMLMGANPIAEKKPALASIVSAGLDQLHHMFGRAGFPGNWSSGAGQWGGQFTAPAFAAALIVDQTWANIIKRVSISNQLIDNGPQEMRQISRLLSGVYGWGDGHVRYTPLRTIVTHDKEIRYWNDMKWAGQYRGSTTTPFPSAGQRTASDPHRMIEGPPNYPGSGYASVSYGAVFDLAGMMILMPKLREVVNHDGIIELADRRRRFGVWASPDTASPPTLVDQEGCDIWGGGTGCETWRTQWGPTLADSRRACTTEGETGRFPFAHGTDKQVSNSGRIGANWASIIALYDGPTYEARVTPLDTCVAPDIFLYPDEVGATRALLWAPNWDPLIFYEVGPSAEATPTPTTASTPYTGPFVVTSGQVVKAITTAAGLTNSAVATSSGVIENIDTTPPAFSAAPFVDAITQTTAVVRASINEAGTLFALVVANNASAPTSATVVSTGVSLAVASGVVGAINLTGLTANTAYDVYVVARDTALNLQGAPTKVDFTTLPEPEPDPEPDPTARHRSAIVPQHAI